MQVFGIIAGIVITGLMAMGGLVHALDVADVVREWTPEGKKLAAERDGMVLGAASTQRFSRAIVGVSLAAHISRDWQDFQRTIACGNACDTSEACVEQGTARVPTLCVELPCSSKASTVRRCADANRLRVPESAPAWGSAPAVPARTASSGGAA